MRNSITLAALVAIFGFVSTPLQAETRTTADVAGRLNWPTEILQHQRPGELDSPVVTQLAINPKLPLVAIVGDDHIVSLVNLDSGRLEKTLKGHSDWIRAAEFVPAGNQLITAGADRKILSWDIETGQWNLFATLPASVEDIAISPDGQKLAVVGFDATLRIYDIATQKLTLNTGCPCGDMRTVQFSPSGNLIVAGGRCGTIRCWVKDNSSWVAMPKDIRAHRQRIRSIDFLNETTIISCSEDRCIKKCDLTQSTATLIAETDGRKFDIEVIDNNTVACCGSNDRIELFDIHSGTSVGFLEGHKGTVSCIEFRSGKLVSGSFDTQARLWKSQQDVSTPALNPDRTAAFDLPAIQRSASTGALAPPPSFK